ncbi:MAG: class II aldolase/adducin family protein [Lachnospiraceae bacterium]|nr:class II aldolase/adducin family protein [Lachnospiraceae bacterium]
MSQIKQEWKQKALEATYRYYDLGLSTSRDSGDVSVRDPETGLIYIDPRPNANFKIVPNWRSITIDDIVVIDIDGNILEGGATGDKKPTIEVPMHLAIYRARPETGCIVHSHALYTGVFAATGEDIPAALLETVLNAGGEIRCAEYGPVSSQLLGDNIVKALGKDRNAALLRQHGAVYIGKDIDTAFMCAEYTERSAHVALLARAAGMKLIPMPTTKEELFDPSIFDELDVI